MASTLWFVIAYSVVIGALYAYVGSRVQRRPVSDDARLAQRAFVTWWYALAATSLAGAIQMTLYLAGLLTIPLYLAFTQLALLMIVVALWGLLFYLIYLYTGSRKAALPLAVFYLLFYIALEILVFQFLPESITDTGWSLQSEPEADIPQWFGLLFLVLLIGPQFVAAIAYFLLFFQVHDPTQKYRIALVSSAIVVWFGVSLVGGFAGLSGGAAWQVASRALGLGAALAVLMAYVPPKWVQRRYGVVAVEAA